MALRQKGCWAVVSGTEAKSSREAEKAQIVTDEKAQITVHASAADGPDI